MRTFRQLLVALLVIALGFSSTAFAQERHAVDPSVLSQAVAGHVSSQDASRAAIHEVLNRPEVRSLATESGFDLDRLNASVDTLTGKRVEMCHGRVRVICSGVSCGHVPVSSLSLGGSDR